MKSVPSESNTVSYSVEVDWCPPYELVISLGAFAARQEHKTLDLGTAWARQVQKQLSPELTALLASPELEALNLPLGLLIRSCPGKRDVDSFLCWLEGLSAGELYELVAPYLLAGAPPLPRDLPAARDLALRVLRRWHQEYFLHVDGAILSLLQADSKAKRSLVATLPAPDLVELASNGVYFTPQEEVDLVVLVPQYHHRPWNVYAPYHRLWLYNYPVDAPAAPGEPSSQLLHITRALADDSRLRILRFLAGGTRSFTDVVRFSHLSKSTVHYHMVALRAAGLVRVHDVGEKANSAYSLRPGAIDALRDSLQMYLEQE
ncbi:MAG TPA: winged helix-turn-helix domain-containing protein [Chloroflexota bacterium]|nr:winged helix-turn-helix domain-containing protein [Chloroflexota bacterium]